MFTECLLHAKKPSGLVKFIRDHKKMNETIIEEVPQGNKSRKGKTFPF